MRSAVYQRFDTPGIAPGERFEYWRSWYSLAVDAPMQLDPIARVPRGFHASAELLGVGNVDIVELRCGPAVGRWAREATEPADRLRLALVAPTPAGTGGWHGRELSLARGAVAVLGRTDGVWRAPSGMRAIQINLPRPAVPVTDKDIDKINDQSRLFRDPTFARLIRPALLGLAGHLDTLANADIPELSELWISLVNMLVRSLVGDDTNGTDTAKARRLQLQHHIRANLADPLLSPTRIADALHVSRRTLYTALSPDQEGVAAEIRRQRLDRARAMLLDPSQRRSVAEVAAAVGLPNAAHFSRIFRARYGHSPRELGGVNAANRSGG
jgi:AraC-like DNA-binding protein